MSEKLRAGIVGATGMVGQRFAMLLENHPWFEVTALAASKRSAGKTYKEAVGDNWKMDDPMPKKYEDMVIMDSEEIDAIGEKVDFVFCAVSLNKEDTKKLEEAYAKHEIPVVSNNSAHRHTADVPMMIPEINGDHAKIIDAQRKRLGTKRGFIAVKPNCSIQSYVPPLDALKEFGIDKVVVSTYQAISGAGKTFKDWPEILDNVIPYIGGEEEKSEVEPLKIWGKIEGDKIVDAKEPVISAQCVRVAVSNGHLATISVKFKNKPSIEQIIEKWNSYKADDVVLSLPSAPKQFVRYMEEPDRPQTSLDRDYEGGMGISVGRLREDCIFDYKFVGLSHNTLRGAAGGAVLSAEYLKATGYLTAK